MAARRDPVAKVTGAIMGFAGRIILLAVLVLLFFKSIVSAYSFGHGLLYEHGMEAAPGTTKSIVIGDKDGSAEVADTLIREGLIDNKQAFMLQAILYQAVFEAGSYELNTSMTIEEILTDLTDEAVKQRELADKNLTSQTAGSSTDNETAGADEDAETHLAGGNAGAEADEVSLE